jgi:hypothetical protein
MLRKTEPCREYFPHHFAHYLRDLMRVPARCRCFSRRSYINQPTIVHASSIKTPLFPMGAWRMDGGWLVDGYKNDGGILDNVGHHFRSNYL